MARLARFWRVWIERYSRDGAYWYVPKGTSISKIDTIRKQLKVLREFEGQRWRESQGAYLSKLFKSGLSEATTRDDDNKGTPMSRMLVQVFTTLGFAWIDKDEAVTLTPAGDAFIAASDPSGIVATPARRYQIANPMAGAKETRQIEVHPVAFLLEVLLQTETITKAEYVLFCAKAKNFADIDDTVESIKVWRKLGPLQRSAITEEVNSVKIAAKGRSTRRTSIYNTIDLNASYALAFWAASRVIERIQRDGATIFHIPRNRLPEANGIVEHSRHDGQFIAFASEKDWMAFYGDPAKVPNKKAALSYYTDTAQLDLVRQVLDEIGELTEEQKRNYLSAIVNEKILEDILERNMDLIEPGMTLIKRQLETEIGRIDLFARDKDGVLTVIELKKDKTDDEVFGQISRYLGWCEKTKARTSNVRGIIIAKRIGKRLWSAVDGHDTPVELMEYDLRMSLEKASRVSN
jgi:hypothetical protein